MRIKSVFLLAMMCVMAFVNFASADTFGAGSNQFTIEFVPISGSTNPPSGYGIVNNDYRIGKFEVTNDQWDKFLHEYGTVSGYPSYAYGYGPYWTGTNVPTDSASWYEAAQFVNWLNTNTGHHAAYKFTGTQGQDDYAFAVWDASDNGYDASNPYRNSNSYYFLPTENEWVKAAYWNGTTLQTYATIGDALPVKGVDAHYYDGEGQPWDVGSCSRELNGTFDMMGNLWEWMESPYYSGDYLSDASYRGVRGGTYYTWDGTLVSSYRFNDRPWDVRIDLGFRVASVPEPATLFIFGLGSLLLKRRKC